MCKQSKHWVKKAHNRSRAIPRPTVTLAMIVKDEEEFLAGCLESAKPFVDEIVVVDTGSTDRTKEIAREFGAAVYDHEWKNDFAEARNVSIRHSHGDWILWLDADERLVGNSGETISRLVNNRNVGAYVVTIRNYQDSKGHHILVHEMCRLFRRLPDLKFEQRIHEQMIDHVFKHGYGVAGSDIVIDHLGYIPEIFNKRGKKKRNSDLLRMELEENPDNLWLLYKKAATHGAAASYHEAIEIYEYVARNGGGKGIGPQLYYEWVDCLTGVGRIDDALGVCAEAMKLGLEHPELHYVWGRALLMNDELDEALEHFQMAVKLGDETPNLTGDSATWGFRAFDGMARVYIQKRDWDQAQECISRSLELMPDGIEALGMAASVSKSQGDVEETRRILKRVLAVDPNEANAHSDLSRLALEEGDYVQARVHLEKMVELFPDRFDLHQQLANVYEELSMPEQALAEYRRTLDIQPRSLYALNNMARVLADRGEYQESLDCISRAIDIDPYWANAYFNAGDILYKIGALEDAKSAYERALQLDPGNAAGFFTLGNCYFKQGAYRAAELAYCQALSIRPDFPEAENNLALAHSFMEESLGAAPQEGTLPRAA